MCVVRADARRNRAAIVAAAHDLVSEVGPDLRMDDLAARAGVAVGTLYRHFPTKQELVAATLAASMGELTELAEAAVPAIERGADPAGAFAELFREVVDRQARDRRVKAAAASLDTAAALEELDADGVLGRAMAAFTAALRAAQQAGLVRDEVTLTDLVALLDAVPSDADEATRRRLTTIVLAGLRPPTA
ncbi:helix-turn-helix transcriptional regulator [Nitriliruptoraceae bacterium ZYF776]|nr:helix-turn-helix transcriptional regulator [Profundirhabdus halotolerans]